MSPPEAEKLRRIHMDTASCSEFASSSEGIKPLVAPVAVVKSNKDVNKQLLPKTVKKKLTRSSNDEIHRPSFSKATDIYMKRKRCPSVCQADVENELLSFPSSSKSLPKSSETYSVPVTTVENEPTSKRKKKEVSSQSNKITSYLLERDLPLFHCPKDCASRTCSESSKVPSTVKCTDVTHHSNSESGRQSVKTDTLDSLQLFPRSDDSSGSKKFEFSNIWTEYFGLFGATEADENIEPSYFNKLPLEVVERIFCELPFLDLQNCKLVCHLWNDVIRNEGFNQWKVRYYKLKLGDGREEEMMRVLLASLDGHSVDNCLNALVRFMKESFSRKPAPDMYDKLKKHNKFHLAECVLKERFPEWSENLNPWCIVATIAILSEEFSDVSNMMQYLLSHDSMSSTVDVLEALYCIASFLLYSMAEFEINHGLHYRVYYSLYMYENNNLFGINTSSVQSIEVPHQQPMHNYRSSLPLTYEQNRIVSHRLQSGDVIKVVAFAGCGKTSTLIELAKCYPQFRFLNIMFNKSVCEHAQKLFPKNVKCQTAHSLAFGPGGGRQFGRRLTSKLAPDVVKQYLKLSHYPFESFSYCKAVVMTVNNFMASDDVDVTIQHAPTVMPMSHRCSLLLQTLGIDQRLHICKSAVKFWELMVDHSKNCPVTHDVYLKLFQLSKPVINQYDCIMVDEAQDCNAAMLDIALSQKVPLILVGDPHQQIYGFRGSINALRDIKSTHTYHLTRSFRFGPEIAYVASCCIEVLKNYRKETLVGCNKPATISGVIKGQYAIISRSNYGLFNEAIRMCCQKIYKHPDEPRLIHGAFIGGIKSYGLDQIEDIYRLKCLAGKDLSQVKPEERPRDKLVKLFQNFRALAAYAEKRDDKELAFKIELIAHHGERIPEYMAILRKKCNTPLELANVVFTTAHKAKGFEFETVRLADDYNVGRNYRDIISKDSAEEYNILYVALTRTKSSLFMSEKLYNILLRAQEKFEYPILSQDLLQYEPTPTCIVCFTEFKPHVVLSLIRRKLTLTTGRTLGEGPLCMKCAAAPVYRPQIIREPVIMYLDPMKDCAHRSLKFLVGPLPSDPPMVDEYNAFGELQAMDLIYVINIAGAEH